MNPGRVLVTGATGYVGGRLVPRLLEAGYRVRAMARDPERLAGRRWPAGAEVVAGDVTRPETLPAALEGVDAAYYLVHSMRAGSDFHERDRSAARSFGRAARAAGVGRIIYLGGLGDPRADLSRHLRSRHETGEALREGGVPVTEFRSAIIVGSGSLSFEMIRDLVERLPIMVCPRWVYTRIQPIAVDDVLEYLVAALPADDAAGRLVEIGGADVITYAGMMLGYAQARELRRRLLPVPVLTPALSSYWVHLVTPILAPLARPLIEGLRSEVIVRDASARTLFPGIRPVSYAEAVRRALQDLDAGKLESSWSDASWRFARIDPQVAEEVRLERGEGMIRERRRAVVAATPRQLFAAFAGIGGRRGWLHANWAWRARGWLDRLAGGVGLRRGRRHPDEVRVGDAVDFWRVEEVVPDRLIRLRAEMRLPGRAWLQFEAHPVGGEASESAFAAPAGALLEQTAFFAPRGLFGLLYWYVLYPVHAYIFRGMARAIVRRAKVMRPDTSPLEVAEPEGASRGAVP